MDVDTGWVIGITVVSVIGALVVPIVTTLLIVLLIVWAIRRSRPSPEEAARAELGRRLAAGEISPVEYEVRMRSIDNAD